MTKKIPKHDHIWVQIGRPIKEGILYYHVCKICKEPRVYDMEHNGQSFENVTIRNGVPVAND